MASDLEKIESYLAALPPEKRAVLEDWRSRIKAFVPEAVEAFSYAMPAFKWRGKGLAAYAAAKNHFGFYPMSGKVVDRLADELKGFKTSSGAIQFTAAKPLTDAMLQRLLDTRRSEITGGTS